LTEPKALSYLGYPIVISQVFPAGVTTSYANQAVCLFGDLSQAAALGERSGLEVSKTDQRYWELRQIGLMTVERIDLNVHDIGYQSTQTVPTGVPNAGPIVALVLTT
jgi:HK97 family phage major capsid protein